MKNDDLLYKHLSLLIPAINKLKIVDGRTYINEANEQLKDTPFMYLITGDGVSVVLREQMVAFAKKTFKVPMAAYY